MKAPSLPRFSELQLVLEPARGELVRAFVREASLAEDVPVSVASLIADDTAQAWLALCAAGSGRERARIALLCSRRDVRTRILLHGHSRFSNVAASLAGRIRRDAGISCHEHGIDGWEISLHRSLTRECRASPVRGRGAVVHAGRTGGSVDYLIDLPQKSDAAAIARCFLEVYGHHYVHSEVFSTHRYWDKVESGELIPAVARDGQGEVIGHVALEREPGALVAERGEAVVLPAYRGHHLLERMTERLSEEAPKHGLQGIYAEPLTIHTFSQRNDERAGMPVCAVLLGANPESFRPKGCALPHRRTAPELSAHLPLRAAACRAHDPRTRALSGDAAQDLREPRRDRVGGCPGCRGCPEVAHRHQGERSRLRGDPFRADWPGLPPSSLARRCATCGPWAPAPCNSPHRSAIPVFRS